MTEIQYFITTMIIIVYTVVVYFAGKGDLLNVVTLTLQNEAQRLTKDIEQREMEEISMNVGIKPCKCGETVFMRSIDDFENQTKTYLIRCHKCGAEVKTIRKIGQISPKKAIVKTIENWNDVQNLP